MLWKFYQGNTRTIEQLYKETKIPVIASGLIMDKDDAIKA